MHYVFAVEHKTVVEGQKVTLLCYSPHTAAEWRFKDHRIFYTENTKYSLHIESGHYELSFSNASSADSGEYDCFEINGGLNRKSCDLTVVPGNCFTLLLYIRV